MLSDVELSLLGEAEGMEAVKRFIHQSLTLRLQNETYYYDNVVKQLRDRDDPEMVWKVMIALSSYASTFANDTLMYSDLLDSVFSYDWRSDRKISIAFVNLLGCMVSANATLLIPAFNMLVKSLIPNELELSALSALRKQKARERDDNVNDDNHSNNDNNTNNGDNNTPSASNVDSSDLHQSHIESMSERCQRVHRSISGLIRLVPTGQAELAPIIETLYPHRRKDQLILTEYVRQLLYMCEYAPMLQLKILDLIISKSLDKDVEIVIEDGGAARIQEDYQGEDEEDLFHLEDDNGGMMSNTHINAGVSSISLANNKYWGKQIETNQRIPENVIDMADKLDAVLILLLDYIDSQLELPDVCRDKLFNNLLIIFEDRVMFTHKSKFVQFIHFYCAKRSDRFAVGFVQRMLRIFLDTALSQNHMKLQSAALYIGSFLARSNGVKKAFVDHVLGQLLIWAHGYVIHNGALHQDDSDSNSNIGNSATNNDNVVKGGSTNSELDSGSNGNSLLDRKDHSRTSSYGSDASDVIASALDPSQRFRSFMTSPITMTNTRIQQYSSMTHTLQERTQNNIISDLARHETFFCCVQVMCYILCFYGVDMAGSIRDDVHKKAMWEQVIGSRLNPLQYCLQSVRLEFCRLVYCVNMFSALVWKRLPTEGLDLEDEDEEESTHGNSNGNKDSSNYNDDNHTATTQESPDSNREDDSVNDRPTLPTPVRVSPIKVSVGIALQKYRNQVPVAQTKIVKNNNGPVMGTGNNPLETFFPFDPCLLLRIHTKIEDAYRVWRGLPGIDIDRRYPFSGQDFVDDDDDDSAIKSDEDDDSALHEPDGSFRRGRVDTLTSSVASSMSLSNTPMAASYFAQIQANILAGNTSDGTEGDHEDHDQDKGIMFNHMHDNAFINSNQHNFNYNQSYLREGMDRHGSVTSAGFSVATSDNEHDDVQHTSAGTQQSQNDQWPPPGRRPRLYSVGSTGSW